MGDMDLDEISLPWMIKVAHEIQQKYKYLELNRYKKNNANRKELKKEKEEENDEEQEEQYLTEDYLDYNTLGDEGKKLDLKAFDSNELSRVDHPLRLLSKRLW